MSEHKEVKNYTYDQSLLALKYGHYAYIKKVVLKENQPIEFHSELSDIAVPFSSINGVMHEVVNYSWEDGLSRPCKISKKAWGSQYFALIGFKKQEAA